MELEQEKRMAGVKDIGENGEIVGVLNAHIN